MLFLRSTGYDPVSRTVTVRYRSPSGTAWCAFEYREVPTDLYSRVVAARPHGQRVVESEVAPSHARRRLGDRTWQPLPRVLEATQGVPTH